MPIELIFCTDGIFPLEVGGMQRHSALLINSIAKFENIQLLVIHPHSEKLFPNLKNVTEYSVEPINKSRNYLYECYYYSKRIYQILRQFPDAIIYSQGLSVWYGIQNLKNQKIINPHGLEPFQTIGFKEKLIALPFRIIFKYLFKHFDKVISLGGELTTILKQFNSANKLVTIANGVNKKNFIQKDFFGKPFKLLFVARFAKNKGIHILMDAINWLNENKYGSTFELHLVGKGPLFSQYLEKYKCENVFFHGFLTDEELNSLYQNSDFFIFPTLFEGMPTVILEAMSFGLPVVSTRTGAIEELVDGNTGILIDRGNATQLVEALKYLFGIDRNRLIEMSQNSISKVNLNYEWSIIAEQHMQLFYSLKDNAG